MKIKKIMAVMAAALIIICHPVAAFAYVDGSEEIGVLGSFYSNRDYDIDRTAYTTVYGYSEMVTYVEEKWGEQIMFGVSLNPFYFYSKWYDHGEFAGDFRGSYSEDYYINAFVSDYNGDEIFYQGVPYSLGASGLGTYGFSESDFKLFDTRQHAVEYLVNGTTNGLIQENIKPFEYNPEIGFDDFRVEIHSSNRNRNYFIRFYYTPTQFMRENGGVCTVEWNYQGETSQDILGLDLFAAEDSGCFELDLTKDYFDFYPYKNLKKSCKHYFLGKEAGFADLDDVGLNIGDLEINFGSIHHVSMSVFDFDFIPSVAGVYGKKFNASVDCLNNTSECYWSEPVYDDEFEKYIDDYVPVQDSYTETKDYYYTELVKDNNGNYIYNYYYINNYGISTPIDDTMQPINPDSSINGNINHDVHGSLSHELQATVNVVFPDDFNINVNVDSGGSSGDDFGNIVIEDDDYSGTSFTDNITNLYGLKDDMATAARNDGALTFLKDFFGVLPGEVPNTVGYGIGSVVFVAIMRALMRR